MGSESSLDETFCTGEQSSENLDGQNGKTRRSRRELELAGSKDLGMDGDAVGLLPMYCASSCLLLESVQQVS